MQQPLSAWVQLTRTTCKAYAGCLWNWWIIKLTILLWLYATALMLRWMKAGYYVESGALLVDGFGDGICFGHHYGKQISQPPEQNTQQHSFGILQATRTKDFQNRIHLKCPSCGRTLFDLQETTARIRAVTNHLKGVKIAIMGCIVNGPGEMADADFSYVGSGVGRSHSRGKEVVKKEQCREVAVEELINLLKESNAWVDAPVVAWCCKYLNEYMQTDFLVIGSGIRGHLCAQSGKSVPLAKRSLYSTKTQAMKQIQSMHKVGSPG